MRIFIEKQRFNQWWLYLIMVIAVFILILPFLLNIEKIVASKDLSTLLIPLSILLLVYFFVFSIHLKTRIDEKGVHYQFFPFNLKFVSWNELEQCFCRSYRPLKEYGGWGYRINSRNGKALNIRGNWGIQLVFSNGKKILIGTQKPDEVKRILESYNIKLSPNKLVNSF